MSRLTIPVLVGLFSGISAATILVWNVVTVALRQRVIPDQLFGRVGASYRFLVFLGMPFGAILGGLLADQFGLRTALAVNGIAHDHRSRDPFPPPRRRHRPRRRIRTLIDILPVLRRSGIH